MLTSNSGKSEVHALPPPLAKPRWPDWPPVARLGQTRDPLSACRRPGRTGRLQQTRCQADVYGVKMTRPPRDRGVAATRGTFLAFVWQPQCRQVNLDQSIPPETPMPPTDESSGILIQEFDAAKVVWAERIVLSSHPVRLVVTPRRRRDGQIKGVEPDRDQPNPKPLLP